GFTELCATTRNCVPQQGSTANLDGIGDRLMFRLAYRNFGDHESVVGNFSVSSGGIAGIRWFELRNVTSGPETVFQQSTYQPDSTWRWLGSAAMDKNGNIALGYSPSTGGPGAPPRPSRGAPGGVRRRARSPGTGSAAPRATRSAVPPCRIQPARH